MNKRRVVVTGIGVESSIGNGVDAYSQGLFSGKCGIREITLFDASGYRTNKAAFIQKTHCQNPNGRIYSIIDNVCEQSLTDSGLDTASDPERIGVSIGTCLGNVDCLNHYYSGEADHNIPVTVLMDQPHSHIASYVAKKYGCQNVAAVADTACSSSTNAIGYAIDRIKYNKADVMIAGGVDPFSRLSQAGFGSLKNLTLTVPQPLSNRCHGIILGEGGAILILEELEHARKRNATILCELPGYGISNDAYHETKPDPQSRGAKRAINSCLKDAGLSISDVDYINAHGTGTFLNDSMELRALSEIFGEHITHIPVSTIKPMIGHTLGASGAMELVACILSIQRKMLLPTLFFEGPMGGYEDIDIVPNVSKPIDKIDVVLSNSFAFGGNMAVIACKRYSEQEESNTYV